MTLSPKECLIEIQEHLRSLQNKNVCTIGSEMQLEMWVENIVYRISQCADEVLGNIPHQTILYGSYARGDYNNKSDIDIMVIADVTKDSLYMYKKPFIKLSSDLGLEYDVVISITIKDLKTFNTYRDVVPFYRNVKNDGIVFGKK